MKRIHIPNMESDMSIIPTAIAVGFKECKALRVLELAMITPVKDNLDSITVGKFLGVDVAKNLMKGKKIPISDTGVSLSHNTVATLKKRDTPKVGIAFYVSNIQLKKLDNLNFDCLIFVPWLDKEGVEWAQKWAAETIGGAIEGTEVNLPQEVEKALTDLTICVNLSTGLAHPSDKEHAKRKFAELRSAGVRWDPAEVEKWAVRNGWRVEDSTELSQLSGNYR